MVNRLGFFYISYLLTTMFPFSYNSRKFLTMVLPSGVNTLSG